MLFALEVITISLLSGAIIGLIPLLVGRLCNKPNLGLLGWKWCFGLGLIPGTQVLAAAGFVVAIIVRDYDYYPSAPQVNPFVSSPAPGPTVGAPAVVNTHLGISCLTGPLKGQVYPVGANGMIIGRDHDCTIRFASNAPGISRHHCSLRWSQGVLSLTDLGSAYGTYMADGRKLPPQYPTQLAAGSRFYLANSGYLFQVVITG